MDVVQQAVFTVATATSIFFFVEGMRPHVALTVEPIRSTTFGEYGHPNDVATSDAVPSERNINKDEPAAQAQGAWTSCQRRAVS